MRARRWVIGAIITIAFSGLFIVVGYWLVKSWHLDGGLISALFTALAAIAAGSSAFSAFLSAQQSSHTALTAARALSLSTKPYIGPVSLAGAQTQDDDGNPATLYTLTIQQDQHRPIARAIVRWDLRDKRTGSTTLDEMAVYEKATFSRSLGEEPQVPGTDMITIDFWGEAGDIGWRRVIKFYSDPGDPKYRAPGGVLFDPNPTVEPDVEI